MIAALTTPMRSTGWQSHHSEKLPGSCFNPLSRGQACACNHNDGLIGDKKFQSAVTRAGMRLKNTPKSLMRPLPFQSAVTRAGMRLSRSAVGVATFSFQSAVTRAGMRLTAGGDITVDEGVTFQSAVTRAGMRLKVSTTS